MKRNYEWMPETLEVQETSLPAGVWGVPKFLVAYPLLRVESEEVEVERLGGVPPGLLRPASIEPFDL